MESGNEEKIRIGISSCLLGNEVRFDGGYKHDQYITGTLGNFFDFVPVCPEVECGMTIPREALRLTGDPEAPRLVTSKSRVDYTERMTAWARKRVEELESEKLCGFIFKSKSPTSGMERVKVYDNKNVPRSIGMGLFARTFIGRFPLLPVEEEGRLHDLALRENFIESVFVYKRWRTTLSLRMPESLVTFHTKHKLILRSHSENHYRELGRIAARAGTDDREVLVSTYQDILMTAMKLLPTVKKHVNVLMHMMGYFKKVHSGDEKLELLQVIDHFKTFDVPLTVPLTLMNHYVRKYEEPYLRKQHYLNPHPMELKLRNHA